MLVESGLTSVSEWVALKPSCACPGARGRVVYTWVALLCGPARPALRGGPRWDGKFLENPEILAAGTYWGV